MVRDLEQAAGLETHGQRAVRLVLEALGRMEEEAARVGRSFRREAQRDLLGRLLEHAERQLGEGFEVEARRRRAGLVEDFEAMHRIEAEEDRLGLGLCARDKIGARAEEEAVRNDLPPARRACVVNLDHAPREQRLAQGSEKLAPSVSASIERAPRFEPRDQFVRRRNLPEKPPAASHVVQGALKFGALCDR